ncbi:hypothetical protein AGMMS49579_25700 [Spirochaetia bacterium]|nr:hypothetical protein AGMMS49579_25700 [Spirochaetia bacterium]
MIDKKLYNLIGKIYLLIDTIITISLIIIFFTMGMPDPRKFLIIPGLYFYYLIIKDIAISLIFVNKIMIKFTSASKEKIITDNFRVIFIENIITSIIIFFTIALWGLGAS